MSDEERAQPILAIFLSRLTLQKRTEQCLVRNVDILIYILRSLQRCCVIQETISIRLQAFFFENFAFNRNYGFRSHFGRSCLGDMRVYCRSCYHLSARGYEASKEWLEACTPRSSSPNPQLSYTHYLHSLQCACMIPESCPPRENDSVDIRCSVGRERSTGPSSTNARPLCE